ncbi:MAG: hypothetical protein JWR10_1922 [Rubritepida sp.]|nr:hypothetical protein [Rubritepida sp.]
MKMTPHMSRDEIQQALLDAAHNPLGEGGRHHMVSVAAQAARAIHSVLKEPLMPFSEEPEVAGGKIAP